MVHFKQVYLAFFYYGVIIENENHFQFGGVMRKNYNTRQKQLILSCLKDNKNISVDVFDIVKFLALNDIRIGVSTIYRYLDLLEEDGSVKKFTDGKSARYQYIDKNSCPHHYHLKCNSCGKLIHLECDCMNELNDHISSSHGFVVDNSKTVIYGKCKECSNNEKN